MKMKLSDFFHPYKKVKAFWYLFPRAIFINESNIEELHQVLSFMASAQYIRIKDIPHYQQSLFENLNENDTILRTWDRSTQLEIQKKMIKEGIIKPTAQRRQSLNDHLANIRNHWNLLKKIGFALFNREKHFFITPAGENFLNSDKTIWPAIFERQLLKLQFWNPSLQSSVSENYRLHKPLSADRFLDKYRDFNIFPYLFILRLLLMLKQPYITVNEFVLFVSIVKQYKQLDCTVEIIEAFRSLNDDLRKKVIREAKILFPPTANASVTLGLFGYTPSFAYENGKLQITNRQRAESLVKNFSEKLKFVNYACFQDWFNYMGKREIEISNRELAVYYTDIGKYREAKNVIEVIDDIQEKKSLQETLEKLFRERLLEDALEKNLNLIENGLKLVNNGRQYRTDVTRIDLLAIDEQSCYVVVELKKDRTDDEVVGQILRYMGWVKNNLSKSKSVRGIIVVTDEEITEKLKMALSGLQEARHLISIKKVPIQVKAKILDVHSPV